MRYIYILFFILTIMRGESDVSLTIKKNVGSKTNISIENTSNGLTTALAQKSFVLFKDDLTLSGNFDVNENMNQINNSDRYVLKYNLSNSSGANLVVSLFNNDNSSLLFQKNYNISSFDKYPFLIHKSISDINKFLGYGSMDWINRLVLMSRYTGSGKSEIVLSDYTFTYKKAIVTGGLNLFPKWANKSQTSFYYTSMSGSLPTIYEYNLNSGIKNYITSGEGMLVCSDVGSNGTKMLLTMSPEGQPDVYEFDKITKTAKRLTDFGGIDVSGQYLNGEKEIVFVSNRLGYPNIFKKYVDSPSVSQVVFKGRENNSCDTRGNKIVYSSRESKNMFGSNTFNIYMISNSSTLPLTSNGENQFPRFSDDGEVVMYIRQANGNSYAGFVNPKTNQNKLFIINSKVQSIDW
ncbi:Translocation protein TolB [Sulfurovum sp. enrichment culture clone C5]|uniref:Translocation protein TolB n=1 Tax=Sulfurovum sp. enrichment culture clone C5 TaxID=497650 RepID=A0A0S4XP47_9BACT|nr:Translocation protein TolB [Sulfurovum sp. enrichment culture clone C5]